MAENSSRITDTQEQALSDGSDGSGHVPASSLSASSLLDAAQYVEAVMSSQQITTVLRTPMAINSSRKRHLSLPAIGESEVKKIKSDIGNNYNRDSDSENENDDSSEANEGEGNSAKKRNNRALRNVVRARRNLLGKKANENEDKKTNSFQGAISDSSDTDKILKAMKDLRCGLEHKIDEMSKNNDEKFEVMKNEMKNEIEKIRSDFNNRMEGLAKKVETKVSKALDKKIDDKVKVIKSNIDKEIQKMKSTSDKITKSVTKVEETLLPTFKEDLGDELDELNRRMKNLEEKVNSSRRTDENSEAADNHKRSIIIKHLDARENENVKDRVNSLIYNGLQLDKIEVETAVRKPTKSDNNPGIIVAVCKSIKDKECIMKRKRDLKRSRRYGKVYIEHHMPAEQRRLNSNLRTIVNTIGSDRLWLKGSRVLQAENNRDYARPDPFQRSAHSYAGSHRDSYDYNRNKDRNYERSNYERRDSDHSHYRSDRNSQGYGSNNGYNYSNRR